MLCNNHDVIINGKRHISVKISLFFKKTKFTLLKFSYCPFKTQKKSNVRFFRIRMGKGLIRQKIF